VKIIIAPDKFKGSLTSFQVCEAIREGMLDSGLQAEILSFPMADGGDGFATVMGHYRKTETIDCISNDPLGRKIDAYWDWSASEKTGIIEMAVASGLVLLKEKERNPFKTSTFGTGQLVKDALEKGAKKIILGLGGSATNDAGMGILSSLGFVFMDEKGDQLQPIGESLGKVNKIIPPSPIPSLTFEIACDVQNTLYGKDGAAFVYAPQKGANDDMVKLLDEGLKHFASILKRHTKKDIENTPGTGAAGGIAAGLMTFFDVELKSGTELIIEASGIKRAIKDAQYVITGEGKIDQQTAQGKVVQHIAKLASENKVQVIAFCGKLQANDALLAELSITKAYSLVSNTVSAKYAIRHAGELLRQAAKTLPFLSLPKDLR
jgi:glycerate kinase